MESMTDLEAAFAFYWRVLAQDAPEPEHEHRFHPERRWRFDFAWPESKIALECEGGTWSGGRHVRGQGYRNDVEKYNAATALGWRVFRCTAGMLDEDPESLVGMIKEAVDGN
jgi:very-short-patch-repair endonuclease